MSRRNKRKEKGKEEEKKEMSVNLDLFAETKIAVANFMLVRPRFRRVSRLNENEAYFFPLPNLGDYDVKIPILAPLIASQLCCVVRRMFCYKRLEMPGIEPGASYMQSMRSTTELHPLTQFWRGLSTLCAYSQR